MNLNERENIKQIKDTNYSLGKKQKTKVTNFIFQIFSLIL